MVVTCMGGLGRSGTLAACLLVSAGTAPEAAIAAVRAARGPRALKTVAHEDFVVSSPLPFPGRAEAVPALAGSGPTERDRRHTAST